MAFTHAPIARKLSVAPLLFVLVATLPSVVLAQELVVDYGFPPPRWMTPIGLPGDSHKSLVDQTGAMSYDFGPGPYAVPTTTVRPRLLGIEVTAVQQTVENARVPIIKTNYRYETADVTSEIFSVLPEDGWQFDGDNYSGDAIRINGINGSLGWATPGPDVDPAFRSVAYGTNRPIDYRLRNPGNGSNRVVLGFADPYRAVGSPVKRLMLLNVEGAESRIIDVVDLVGKNAPLVVQFDSKDIDGDGWIDVRVESSRETVDGNLFVSAIWVFQGLLEIDEQRLIRGDLSDNAHIFVDCGRDQQVLERGPRTDLMHVVIDAANNPGKSSLQPVLEVRSRRTLQFDSAKKNIRSFGEVFIETEPPAISATQTETGWELIFEKGTDEILVSVHNESRHQHESIALSALPREKDRLTAYWLNTALFPWDKITIPDLEMQALFDGSIRTIYQLTERVDGILQTQPGPSVYRGLWVSNQPRVGRALTHLGDYATPRSSFGRTFEFQSDDGQIVVLSPATLLKETGQAMHSIYLHAAMTRDKQFLESYWPMLKKGADWIIKSRKSTTDSTALNYGLMPSGTSDGGVGGIVPEYTTVYWSMLGLKGVVEGAEWLGKTEDAMYYRAEFAEFWSVFRRAAARDMKQDEFGNSFLPIRMNFDPAKHEPQRSQTQFSHTVYPGRLFDKDDAIVAGNMAMLDAAPKSEGLVLSTGWLNGGIQPFIENTRASARLYLGEVETVQAVLYSIANHAAPTHVWIEEHRPGTGPRKATGDVPHSSASAEFINLIRYLLVIEDGNHVELLRGIPDSWIYPGAQLGVRNVPTELGDLTLNLSISKDGEIATLKVSAVNGKNKSGQILINMRSLKNNGFVLVGQPTPDFWGMKFDSDIVLELKRSDLPK